LRIAFIMLFVLLSLDFAQAQMATTSVSVRQVGTDAIGPLLKQAVQAELNKSGIPDANQASSGFRHFIELVTLGGGTENSESSFVSVVITSMTPNGWSTPDLWYHKVVLVNATMYRTSLRVWSRTCGQVGATRSRVRQAHAQRKSRGRENRSALTTGQSSVPDDGRICRDSGKPKHWPHACRSR